MSTKIMHAPQPGPMYWDFKCLRCDGLVADHANLIERIIHQLRPSVAAVETPKNGTK